MIQRVDEHHFYVPWDECRALRKYIESRGLPSDPDDIRTQFVQAVLRAEQLRVLFHGTPDAGAENDARALVNAARAAAAFEEHATHGAHGTAQ